MIRSALAALLGICLFGSSGFAQSVTPAQQPASAQAAAPTDLLRVFLDCAPCDIEFIKTAITFVTFASDRAAADVQITGSAEMLPSGARKWSFVVAGQGRFA